ncbi:D-alanyl-D-alanine-carboxypeptidase/endopeptidase AmpH precursor [Candidatus Nitrosocosmicus oleophilus]|uniref:D-alanyl-D-alanine-carboxypeptidase/endopeptidase AmpH n=1 Tax=Candidatus Nitrosocosmicus oleophilus TaxID=1353260 RepID=A0A654LUE2_9ARCH|nr:D-alanyl-D-alanine-carboxypeptidase/endopeptidase AmpH precursor [Candidatus Nitrosocosmicus oleophilus]
MKRYHSLAKSFVAFFIVSIILSASSLSQSWNIHVSAQNPKENNLQSSSLNQSEINDLSKAILDKYKPRVLEHLFGNKTIASNISSNSSIPAAIVVGVITPNGTQVSAYGNISKSNPTPVDGNTIFDVGSVTKTFVATVLADLVNQGVVKLSDPLEMYLPSNVTVPSYNGSKITLGDLATHTSGLPYWPSGWIWNKYYTTQQVYEFLSNSTFEDEPGTVAKYSNIGMGMVGQAISLKMGVPLIQLIEDRILNVLGMNSTGFAMNKTGILIPQDIKSRFAAGHMVGNESKLVFLPQEVQAAGAMYSTANDLLKYVSANLGLIDTKINSAMEETHSIRYPFYELQVPFPDPSGNESTPYAYEGLSWFSTTNLGTQVVWHNGGIDGYSSFVGFNPDKQIGLVILCSCFFTDVPPIEMLKIAVPFLLYYPDQ